LVQCNGCIPFFRSQFLRWLDEHGTPGIVNEHINATKSFNRFRHHDGNVFRYGHIGGNRNGLPTGCAELLYNRINLLLAATGNDYPGTRFDISLRNSATDASRSASDDCNLTIQNSGHTLLLLF